jgi:DNA-binding response OmpR family regulator
VVTVKILVVEDDMSMQESICIGLNKFGYAVDAASDGEEALLLFEVNRYDAVVLDLSLPKIDGIDVLKQIREVNQELGVLVLSARSEVEDKVLGLDTGANDYMAKPFHFKELEARLRALMRRKFVQEDIILTVGELMVDTALKCVYAAGEKVDLTNKEYGILEYLLLHKDAVVSAEEIIEHVWDSEVNLFSNSFRVHLNALKKKLAAHLGSKELIKNVRNVGYFIVKEDVQKCLEI